ncbi:MAG: DEAD/DEAH box helicase family protein, partial [Oscillospiraceae bacterium]|nr:DEAD/DEAH box helicase family protein [Oscillospiraceae bacterium]
MILDLSELSRNETKNPINPEDIFSLLPKKHFPYTRSVQTDVWRKWFDKRNQKNSIIKMNTGSGKTIVGLIILQSCLYDEVGPAVYVVPDKYLVEQVCAEADKLGIKVTTDINDPDYISRKSIFVTTVHKIVNGRSVFLKSANKIGSILLDDVHACLDKIHNQFSIKISSSHNLYTEMINLFSEQWKNYNSDSYYDITERKDSVSGTSRIELLPFWIWQSKKDDIYKLISNYDND